MIFETIYYFYDSLLSNDIGGFFMDSTHIEFICSLGTYATIICGVLALFRILGGILRLFKV